MTNEIVQLPEGQSINAMAQMVYKSGFFGVKNAEEAGALLLIAQAEGKHPMKAIQEYDVIKGRPALKSSAVFGRFRQAGGKLQWLETNDTVAKCRAEIDGTTIEIEWTIERARKIGLVRTGSGWENYPAAMLRARAQVEAVRAIAPEVLAGMYCSEEVVSFDDRKPVDVTPKSLERQEEMVGKPIEQMITPAQEQELDELGVDKAALCALKKVPSIKALTADQAQWAINKKKSQQRGAA